MRHSVIYCSRNAFGCRFRSLLLSANTTQTPQVDTQTSSRQRSVGYTGILYRHQYQQKKITPPSVIQPGWYTKRMHTMGTSGGDVCTYDEGHGKPKVLVLTGATAVGKTATSIKLAKVLQGEIVSADSVQVYKGLDVGSDKITRKEMDGVPHHLIDVLEPTEDFSAGDFYFTSKDAIDDIISRGKTPIVVGGTGFYLKWLISGKPSTPVSNKESEEKAKKALEDAWEQRARRQGKTELMPEEKWLAGVELVRDLGDEDTARRLQEQEANNWYRMNRVVDILLQAPGKTLADLDRDGTAPVEYDFRCFFLHRPRIQLYRRIDERVEVMMSRGLLRETWDVLLSKGIETDSNCATRAIGYRQAMMFLQEFRDGRKQVPVTEHDIVHLTKEIQTASRQLCHRQMNWFRKESNFRWIQADQSMESILEEITTYWNRDQHEGGGGLKRGRLTKDEEKQLKTYVTELKRMTPGSSLLTSVVEDADDVLRSVLHVERKEDDT